MRETAPAPSRAAILLPWDKQAAHEASRLAGRLRPAEARLAEAVGLAASIGLVVVRERIFPLRSVTPATLFGKGQVEMEAPLLGEAEVDVVVVDAALTPVQQRNLEKAWGAKVIDRTGLILDIFGARTRTREGALQVELAHLEYQRSRLVR
ncbi:MAG TPA: GTPase HflX, partial [Acidocella sp.]|nr:GTPase HflX [Acidocella sp.]